MNSLQIRFILFFGLLFPYGLFSQNINVNTSYTPAQLADLIKGTGITVSNITYTGSTAARGYFEETGGITIVNIDSGAVLGTGFVVNAQGPNLAPNTFTDMSLPGDADLDALLPAGQQSYDATILEFDFVPSWDSVGISFVFASEEYDERISAGSISDIVAVFISGPGIVGQQNIALVPGSNAVIRPVNVNSSVNASYYVPNTGNTCEYDGLTTRLHGGIRLTAGNTYHIKIAIADGGTTGTPDRTFDSAIFVEAHSFKTEGVPSVNIPQDTVNVCSGDNYSFTATSSNADTIIWQPSPSFVTGTLGEIATYNNITSDMTVYAIAYQGGSPGDTDSVAVTVTTLGTMYVSQDTVCEGDTATLLFTGTGTPSWNFGTGATPSTGSGTGPHIVSWSGAGMKYITLNVGSGTCSQTLTDSVYVLPAPSNVQVTPASASICVGDTVTLIPSGGITYTWFPGNIQTGVLQVFPDTSTTYQMVAHIGQCSSDTVNVPITVIQNPDPSFNYSSATGCSSDSVIVTYAGTDTNTTTTSYYWTFQSGNPSSATGIGPHSVVWTNAGNYEVSLTVQVGSCSNTFTDTFTVYPKPIADAGADVSVCAGDSVQLNGSVSVTSGCVFQWLPFQSLDNPFIEDPKAFPDTTTTYYFQTVCNGCPSDTDSVKVFVEPRPSLVFNPVVNHFCAGSGGVQLNGVVTGGVGPYSYQWFPNIGLSSSTIPNPIANPPMDTIYKVVAIGANGCPSDTALVQVIIDSLPVVDAGPDIYLCEQGPGAFLQPTILNPQPGGYSYSWTPAAGLNDSTVFSPYARPDSTTIYNLIVTHNLTGCSSDPTTLDSIGYVTVFVTPKPIADAGPDSVSICVGEQIQIGALPSGGGPTYQFEWNPALGLSDSSVMQPWASPVYTTTYQLVVISNGCRSNPDYITVVVNPRPTVAVTPVLGPVCPGDSVQLNAIIDVNALPPISYQWTPTTAISNPNIPNPKVAPMITTYYKVSVSTGNCISPVTDSTLVQVYPSTFPDADTTGKTLEVCRGDSLQLPAKIRNPFALFPVYFYWTPATGMSDSTILNPNVSPDQTTTYYLVTEHGGCVIKDSVTVYVLENVSASLSVDKEKICSGDTIQLTTNVVASNPVYHWINPGTAIFTTPDSSAGFDVPESTITYVLEVINGKCSDTAKATVQVFPRAKADFLFNYDTGCDSLRVSFRNLSSGASFYAWYFGDSSEVSNDNHPIHTYYQTGNYIVELVAYSEGTCSDTLRSSIPITIVPGPKAYFTSTPQENTDIYFPDTDIEFQDASQGNITRRTWDFGDGHSEENTANPHHKYEYAGFYEVTLIVESSEGCIDTFSRKEYRIFVPEINIPNVFTPNGDGVNDFWEIPYFGNKFKSIEIYDRYGNRVFRSTDNNFRWDGGNLPAGQYFYVIQVDEIQYKGSVSLIK